MTKLTEERITELWSWANTAEAERTANTKQHAFARAIEAELQPEPVTGRSPQPPIVAILPNGATASNVYAAYEEGRKSVEPAQEPAMLDLIAATEANDKLNELCREQTAEIERLKELAKAMMERQAEIKNQRIATLEAALREAVLMLKTLRPTTDNYDHRVAINHLLATINKALGEE